jgi:U3 small nucleolar RNA-associated protein 13
MQVLSGSADGLVRLWNVGTGECVATFDEHQDKVWALAVPSEANIKALASAAAATAADEDNNDEDDDRGDDLTALFVSGGGDSCIRVWTDRTREEEKERLEEQEQQLEHAQQLDNDVRNRRFDKVSSKIRSHFNFISFVIYSSS